MTWRQIVFGWPFICVAVGAFLLGLARRRSSLGFVGCVSALPFLWYTLGAPGGQYFSPLMLALIVYGAWSLSRGRRRRAAWFMAPFLIWIAWLAAAVLTQR